MGFSAPPAASAGTPAEARAVTEVDSLTRRDAIHEAAHVVAARAVGYEVTSAEVSAYKAEVWYRVPVSDDPPASRSRQLMVVLAGELAVYLVEGREDERARRIEDELAGYLDDPDSYEWGWFEEGDILNDTGSALRLLEAEVADPHGEDPREFLRSTIAETIELLRERREELDAVVLELLQ